MAREYERDEKGQFASSSSSSTDSVLRDKSLSREQKIAALQQRLGAIDARIGEIDRLQAGSAARMARLREAVAHREKVTGMGASFNSDARGLDHEESRPMRITSRQTRQEPRVPDRRTSGRGRSFYG